VAWYLYQAGFFLGLPLDPEDRAIYKRAIFNNVHNSGWHNNFSLHERCTGK
jgi:hypothetical protein